MYGQAEHILDKTQLLKYFKPYDYPSMANALAEEWLLTFDNDRDDYVDLQDFETIISANPYYKAEAENLR